jgi:polar amino acid transport system substrate-binding protein
MAEVRTSSGMKLTTEVTELEMPHSVCSVYSVVPKRHFHHIANTTNNAVESKQALKCAGVAVMRQLLFIILSAGLIAACQSPEPPAEADTETETVTTPAVAVESASDACHLSMGWDPWEPYHFIAAGGQVQGLDVDLVSALAEDVGCSLEFVQGNWASLLRLIRLGDLDLLPGATHTPEREDFSWFSDPYREEHFMVYVRIDDADEWQDQSIETLLESGFRIGVTQGYIYPQAISRFQGEERFRGQFIEAAVGELNFSNLMDHRIDGFVEDPFVAAAIQRRRSWGTEIVPLELDFSAGEVHLLFSRESTNENLVNAFNEALEGLRDDGRYDQIMARYLD